MKSSLRFEDLKKIVPGICDYEDCSGGIIAYEFNHMCELELCIEYVEDSEWRFVLPHDAFDKLCATCPALESFYNPKFESMFTY